MKRFCIAIAALVLTSAFAFADQNTNAKLIQMIEEFGRTEHNAPTGDVLFEIAYPNGEPMYFSVKQNGTSKVIHVSFITAFSIQTKNLKTTITLPCPMMCEDRGADGRAGHCTLSSHDGTIIAANTFFTRKDQQARYTDALAAMAVIIEGIKAHRKAGPPKVQFKEHDM